MYLHNDTELFLTAINLTSYQSGLTPEIIEKDYYVTLLLKKLAEQYDFIVFKGGTSLQKCYRVIDRFSEDIDIAVSRNLTQGEKRNFKYGIFDAADCLGLTVSNPEEIRSRRDYNRYILSYPSFCGIMSGAVLPAVLLETSFTGISFPAEPMLVHSYLGDFIRNEEPAILDRYELSAFCMNVQGLKRTLIDKVFAVCDYYMGGNVKRHSRHIYDIYKILPLVEQNKEFHALVNEVRAVRAQARICLSAQAGVDVPDLLKKIICEDIYKEDYEKLTVQLLKKKLPYEKAIMGLKVLSENGMFDEL